VAPRRGLFEEAAGGTLFLDEIATVSPSIQVKLLRVLQERKIQRVGGGTPVTVDFRLVAACNVRLEDEVEGGRFREDLFYRLNVFPIHVPPLRERGGDVPLLAEHFRRRVAREHGVEPPEISPQALARMTAYEWPGNVRELENFVERAAILHAGAATLPFEPPRGTRAEPARDLATRARRERWTLDRLEREHVLQVLEDTGGNQVRAAEVLGIDRRTLHRKLKLYRDDE
jgi:DNA-binding NtrC family response regulator